jgi:hypothetical protein
LNAIQGKVTNKVTGGNMAHLIEAIRKDDLFSNQKAVNAAI